MGGAVKAVAAVLGISVLGAATWFFFLSNRGHTGIEDGSLDGLASESLEGPSYDEALDGETEVEEGRTKSDLEGDAKPGESVTATVVEMDVPLRLTGRVVNEAGAPVAGAEVGLYVRESMQSMFARMGQRGRGRGPGRAGPRGFGGQNWRNAFRMKKSGPEVRSDAQGRFELAASAFADSNLELAVQHKGYAPKTVRQDWSKNDGSLSIGDIALEAGGSILGQVVTEAGAPVEGASLRLERSGGRGRGPGRGRRGGFGNDDVLQKLLGSPKTDATGRFEMRAMPTGSFELRVEKKGFLEGRSSRFELRPSATLMLDRIVLQTGLELSGRVLDRRGKPIADAEVVVSNSWQSMRERFGRRGDNGGRGQSNGQRGGQSGRSNRGNRGGGRRGFGRLRRSTKTNAKGEWRIDTLPRDPVQVTANHKGYLENRRDPVDPRKEAKLDLVLEPALSLEGRVVDARTNQAVELFGIRARRQGGWGGPRGFGGGNRSRPTMDAGARGRRGGNRSGNSSRGNRGERPVSAEEQQRQAERQARQSTRNAERARREARMRAYFGPSGQVPGRAIPPTKHADGRFALGDLQPGQMRIEVSAPGYVPQVVGPVNLEKGKQAGAVLVRLEKGSVLSGVVLGKSSGAPIAGARIKLLLPRIDVPQNSDGGMDLRAMFSRFGRGGNPNDVVVEEKRSASDGKFRFRPVRPGAYWLEVEADGHDIWLTKKLQLLPGRDLSKFTVQLVAGARVSGRVLHMEEGARYRVQFRSEDGRRFQATVQAKTQSYEVRSLPSGKYFVDLNKQGDRSSMLAGVLAAATGKKRQPDLIVAEGADLVYNLDASRDRPASLVGTVRLNGAAAKDVDATLRPLSEDGSEVKMPGGGRRGPGRGGLGRMLGRVLRGRTNAEGRFEIGNLPAGAYVLELRKRGRGSSTMHKQNLTILAGMENQVQVSLEVGSLSIQVFVVKDGKSTPATRGTASLVLAEEGRGKKPEDWRELPSFQRGQVRAGKLEVSSIPSGTWLYRVQLRQDKKRINSEPREVLIGAGEATGELRIQG